ncbi:hypothetical protein J2Z60_000163 [Lactobacillus colini]|uniref:Terminase n=1 Tax=Lactobacillus colini TaxID=1819254 RepID=A0ABS4MCD6_9LACO|nr:hypothetical protein [Lactobacillus colini]MBP2057001.1 hypothetical protein [Lactobacillus colini]
MVRRGNQQPTFRYTAKYSQTEGDQAAALSAAYDLKPHPWQKMVLQDWLATNEYGALLNSYCILEVPRQNGKTGVSDPRETWGLVKRGEQILHTAQEFQTAKKAFDRLRKKFGTCKNDPFAEYPELNALVDHYTVSAGQMVLDLVNGGHIEFRTRGSNSDMGRGGTFDLVVIDEAQSYTEAQDAALSPLNSAAPSGSPQTILMGTPPTPEAVHKGFIFSNSIKMLHDNPKPGMCLHQWSVEQVGDPLDKKRWYRTNPSLGFQLLESALDKDSISMAPDMFAREHLGFINLDEIFNSDLAIDPEKWQACVSDSTKPEGKTAYGIKFSLDGSRVSLCGAVIPKNGKARISLIKEEPTSIGLTWLVDWLSDRYTKASCVVIDGKNGVDILIDRIKPIWRAKTSIVRPSATEMIDCASLLINSINENKLTWYQGQEMLNQSAITATKRKIAGGFGFGGDQSGPIEACSLALWGAKHSKRNPKRKMRIG